MTAVSLDTALDWVLRTSRPGSVIPLPLRDILGHYLGADITASIPLPPWRSSSMDGYAARAADFHGTSAPWRLRLGGTTLAGESIPPPLSTGEVWQVATGGRIPENADSIIRLEDATCGDHTVIVHDGRDLGQNLRQRGGDVEAGVRVIPTGSRVYPGTIATLAALGVTTPLVVARPRVLILASGNELADPASADQVRSGERLADANTPMLEALVREAGGTPIVHPALPDDPEQLAAAIGSAGDVDIILTAGGISVGPHDFAARVMKRLAVEIGFSRVRIRPGGPVSGALLADGRLWLALPGNPISAWTTFHLLAQPAIRRTLGDPRPTPAWRDATLHEAVARHPTLDLLLRVHLQDTDPPVARVTGPQESWRTTALASAAVLARIPAGEGTVPPGATVRVTGVQLDGAVSPSLLDSPPEGE